MMIFADPLTQVDPTEITRPEHAARFKSWQKRRLAAHGAGKGEPSTFFNLDYVCVSSLQLYSPCTD